MFLDSFSGAGRKNVAWMAFTKNLFALGLKFQIFSAWLAYTEVIWHILSRDLAYSVHLNLESFNSFSVGSL